MGRDWHARDAVARVMASWVIGALSGALTLGAQQSTPCDVFCHSRLAARAEAVGDLAEHASHVRAVAALAPSHPAVVYQMARTFARAGMTDSAITWLARLGHMGDTHDPEADSAFAALRQRPDYVDARNRLLANRLPLIQGRVAFEIADVDFLPEALAFDSVRNRFLVGSLAKREVSAFSLNGQHRPFIAHAPGVLRVVGVHADAPRDRLWFATWAPDSTARSDTTETPSVTRLFLAELETGHIVRSWTPQGGRAGHLLNDFVVMQDGSLLITDTEKGSIYRLRSPSDSLELFVQPDPERFTVANGITASPDGRTLYVAFLEGIARVDVATREVAVVPGPDSVSSAAIDGLYWYDGGLIGVQGIPTLARVVRYALSPDGHRIESVTVLEHGRPVVNEPTTGVLVGNRFYYIANSQYGRLSNNGSALQPQTDRPVRTAVRVIELR